MRCDVRWLYAAAPQWRRLFRRSQADQELDEELQYHLDHLIAAYQGSGLTFDEARRTALRDIGGLQQVKESCCGS